MNKFHLTISTPKGVFLDSEVSELYLETGNGYMAILSGMDDLITSVETNVGFIKINTIKKIYAIFEGIVIINNKNVNLIVSNIELSDDINLERANKSKNRAIERLKSLDKNIDMKRVKQSLLRANARIKASKKEVL